MQAQTKTNGKTNSKREMRRELIDWDDEEEIFPRRSKEEIARILGDESLLPRRVSPWRIVKFQVVLTILFTILSVLGSSPVGWSQLAKSVLAGGVVGVVPTAIFALRLSLVKKTGQVQPGSYVVALVSGEFIKILATVVLVAIIAWNAPNLKWLPMLVMYILTLKCYWLAWFFDKKFAKR